MNNCWTLEKGCLAPVQKIDLCIRCQNYSSTEIHMMDHNSNNLEVVGTPSKHNPDEVGRHHNNEEEHQSERFRNMVVEYHIMNQRKVPKSVWLVMAGRLKRFKCVVCVHCHMALDSVLQLENCIFMVVSQTIFTVV